MSRALSCALQDRYQDAIQHYQPLVVQNVHSLLGVSAVVLANLCVCFIMTSQVRGGPCLASTPPLLPCPALPRRLGVSSLSALQHALCIRQGSPPAP
jgi:hypothetical protein